MAARIQTEDNRIDQSHHVQSGVTSDADVCSIKLDITGTGEGLNLTS